MKLRQIILLLSALVLISALGAETLWVVNSQSRTLSRINTDNAQAENNFAILGNIPNRLAVEEDALWVVNSGDNSIQKINPNSGQTMTNYLVEVGSNPWDMVIHDGFAYITGLFTGKVYKMNLSTGSVVASLSVGESPEGMAVHNGMLYTVCTGDYMQNYGGSAMVVIDLDSFSIVKEIDLPANPQYVVVHDGNIHVSCTGNWADVGGKIVILTEDADVITTLNLGGTPGNIWFNHEGVAYVANNSGDGVYSYSFDGTNATVQTAPAINASEVCGNEQIVAFMTPDWGDNGTVGIYHSNLSLWKSYTVGMMPTDMKLKAEPVSVDDELIPVAQFGVYPNPVCEDGSLKLDGEIFGETTVTIYNLRGQLVKTNMLRQNERSLDISGLKSGLYLYRVKDGKTLASGKFIVIK